MAEGAGWLEFHLKIAAVLRRPVGDALGPEEAPPPSSATRWSPTGSRGARAATRSPRRRASLSIGPCVVTTDEIDPQTTFVTVRVDGEEWVKGNLNGTALGLLRDVARASVHERLEPGETFASGPFEIPGLEQRIWPGAEVELEAEGIGLPATASAMTALPLTSSRPSGRPPRAAPCAARPASSSARGRAPNAPSPGHPAP